MADPEFELPLGEIPQDPPPTVPEMIPENWTPLKKALDSYTRIVLSTIRLWIRTTDESRLNERWKAQNYSTSDPPDKTKILLKSPLELGLSEAEIQKVIKTTRILLAVNPPDEWLELLRVTNGVRGAGFYNLEPQSRYELEPFSSWENVEAQMIWWAEDTKQTKSVPVEIEQVFAFTDRIEGFTLICGFMCGMLNNEDGSNCGVFYLFGEYTDTETNRSLNKVGKRWELVGNIAPRDGFRYFSSIEATLEEWARSYLTWSDSFQRRLLSTSC
jgi:hypothetical protein